MTRLTQFFEIRFRHHLVSTIQNFFIMKYTVLLAFVLALSVATNSVANQALHVAFERVMKSTKAPSAESMLRAGAEDIKFCGTYESECQLESGLGSKMTMKILGMMHKNPIYMMNTADVFMEKCDDAGHLMGMTVAGALKEVNDIEKKLMISCDKILVTFYNEMATSAYTCKEPIEIGKEYNVMDLDCKDESGEDPFADVKKVIGTSQEGVIVFGEEYIKLDEDTLKRTADTGCTCASDLMKAATESMSRLAHKKEEDDVKFCGTYRSDCLPDSVTMQMDLKLMGVMNQDPTSLVYPVTIYMAPSCIIGQEAMKMSYFASMKTVNSEKRKFALTFEKIKVIYFNDMIIQGYTCTTPIEVGTEYNIMDLDCKDASGEDPFAENKKMIGTTQESDMEFGENSLKVLSDGSELELQRIGDEGCTCERHNLRHFFTKMM